MADMSIKERLREDMKSAMRAKAADRLGLIRMLIAAVKNQEIALRRELTDADVIDVLTSEAKKRREAEDIYRKNGRSDLADKEAFELTVLSDYLPQALTDEEATQIVAQAIADSGAVTKRDMGKVMGRVMAQVKGRYDGSKVKDIVLGLLE